MVGETMSSFVLGLLSGIVLVLAAPVVAIKIWFWLARREPLAKLGVTIEELAANDRRHDYVLSGGDEQGVILQLEKRLTGAGTEHIFLLFPISSWRVRYARRIKEFLAARNLAWIEEAVSLRKYEKKSWGEKQLGDTMLRLSVDAGPAPEAALEIALAVLNDVFEVTIRKRWLSHVNHRSKIGR